MKHLNEYPVDRTPSGGENDVLEPQDLNTSDEQKIDKYRNLRNLTRTFLTKRISFDNIITVDGIKYNYLNSTNYSMIEYSRGKKAAIIFGTPSKQKAKQIKMTELLIFVWKISESGSFNPIGIIPTTKARAQNFLMKEQVEPNNEPNIIGDTTEVMIVKPAGFAFGTPLKGKVDTGASMCSLHVDNWRENGENIEFVSSALADGKRFTIPKDTMMSVKSAESTEYRPVVLMSLKINGILIPDIQVNLNNRAQMKYPLLIGQNALEKGKFLIDPSKTKEMYEQNVDENEFLWENIEQLIEEFNFEEQTQEFKVEVQYQRILQSPVSFDQILRHIKTEALNAIENVEP